MKVLLLKCGHQNHRIENRHGTLEEIVKFNQTHNVQSTCFVIINIKHLSESLITDITFIQARQAISDEPKASHVVLARLNKSN